MRDSPRSGDERHIHARVVMGAGASSLNAEDVATIAKTPVAYAPPLGEPRSVRATRRASWMIDDSLTWR